MLGLYAKCISCINQVAAIALSVQHVTLQHTCNQRILASQFQGLFSRITFREPLFVGGPGNTTGLERLPVRTGFKGCIRHLEANEHHYRFPLAPQGDAANGFDVGKYRITGAASGFGGIRVSQIDCTILVFQHVRFRYIKSYMYFILIKSMMLETLNYSNDYTIEINLIFTQIISFFFNLKYTATRNISYKMTHQLITIISLGKLNVETGARDFELLEEFPSHQKKKENEEYIRS